MRLCRSLIGAVAITTLLVFASPASAQRHGHGGGSWHGHPGGWHGHPGWGGTRVAFGFGFPFWGWGYPYAPYGYGYYPYAYAPVYAPRVYEGHVVTRQQPVDAKDVSSRDE